LIDMRKKSKNILYKKVKNFVEKFYIFQQRVHDNIYTKFC
jgi:hypothetical protein